MERLSGGPCNSSLSIALGQGQHCRSMHVSMSHVHGRLKCGTPVCPATRQCPVVVRSKVSVISSKQGDVGFAASDFIRSGSASSSRGGEYEDDRELPIHR